MYDDAKALIPDEPRGFSTTMRSRRAADGYRAASSKERL